MNIYTNSNSFPVFNQKNDAFSLLQLKSSEVQEACLLLQNMTLHEEKEVVEEVIALRKIGMMGSEGISHLSDFEILKAITKLNSPQKSLVISTLIDLHHDELFFNVNNLKVLEFLDEVSNKNVLSETLSMARRFFLKDTTGLESLKLASKQLQSGLIEKKLALYPQVEVDQTLKLLKMRVEPHHFQEALFLILEIPMEKRQGFIDTFETLLEIKMGDFNGDSLNFLTALKTLPKFSSAKRTQAMDLILNLHKKGVKGVNQLSVLVFFMETPENMVDLTLRIAKGAFFDYGKSEKTIQNHSAFYYSEWRNFTSARCSNALRFISKIVQSLCLSEEQIKALENIKIEMKVTLDYNEQEEIFLEHILFGDQDSIRHIPFELAKGNYRLSKFVKQAVEKTSIQPLYEEWARVNHFQLTENKKAYKILLELNQKISKIANAPIYLPNLSKPFPKNLIARHSPSDKQMRNSIKKALQTFLDQKFTLDLGESNDEVVLKFDLNKNCYEVSQSRLKINDVRRVSLDDSDLINKRLLSSIFNGNRFEIITKEGARLSSKTQIKNEFWDNWEFEGGSVKHYKNEIDPMICRAFQTIIQSKFWHTPPVVLDVGGGSGRLANAIFNLNLGSFLNYTLLEKNELEIKKANEVIGSRARIIPTDIVEDPIFYFDQNKTVPIVPNSVDIAIASGVLAHKVLKGKKEALIALKKVCASIKPRGFILLTSLTHCHITSEDLKNEGFEVINSSLPNTDRSFYIARKKAVPLKEKLLLDLANHQEVEKDLSKLPYEEREDVTDFVHLLQQMQLRDHGVLLPTQTLLEMVVNIPSMQRILVNNILHNLFGMGIKGANEKGFWDFLIQHSSRSDFAIKVVQATTTASQYRINELQGISNEDSCIEAFKTVFTSTL